MIIIGEDGKVKNYREGEMCGSFVANKEGEMVCHIILDLNPDHKNYKGAINNLKNLLDMWKKENGLVEYRSGI